MDDKTLWIDPNDRLPPTCEIVPVVASGQCGNCTYTDYLTLGVYDKIDGAWYLENGDGPVTVTWWVDLPDPPRKDDGMTHYTALTKNTRSILDRLPLEELLCQLSEESRELAQAALKLRRARTGTNPTPRTERECIENLAEEYADIGLVYALIRAVLDDPALSDESLEVIQTRKAARWAGRLDVQGGAK